METADPPVHFLNLEYFFRILYNLFHGRGEVDVSVSGLLLFMSHIWLIFTIISYFVSLALIGIFVYSTMRYLQVRREEAPRYTTISQEELHEQVETSRWNYIQQLIESGQESDWRQAIIEADIILDELLTRLGYPGDSVGEKLKAVNPERFHTLQNAWEGHKVRNEIAHQGYQYKLEEHLAHRTIANYEAVFREHEEL